MNCPKCHSKVSELDERCPNCGLNFEEYEEEQTEEDEEQEYGKTTTLRIINIIQLIAFIIVGFINWLSNNESALNGFIYIGIGIILFVFIKGFADIIELLSSINQKLDK